MIDRERLVSLLDYNPDTGVFLWKARPAPHAPVHVGAAAGGPQSRGYLGVMIDGKRLLLHRLAWLWMTGSWPADEVDHKNRVRTDNRWANLRAASKKQNRENTGLLPSNQSGIRGVSWSRRRQKWRAHLGHKGRYIDLGEHRSLLDAVAARLRGERAFFTHSEACEC